MVQIIKNPFTVGRNGTWPFLYCQFRSESQHVKAAQVGQQLSVVADWWSSCCVRVCECVRLCTSECVCWHGNNCGTLLKLDTLFSPRQRCCGDSRQTRPGQLSSSTAALMWFLPPPHLSHWSLEPCPRLWRRGRTTGLTKSTRVSSSRTRTGSWGWSWRAARRTDSSPSSPSLRRRERCATAVNSSRMNCCWKSTIPRWSDSPPGTSTLWSDTAKTRSDSSVWNKVRVRSLFSNLTEFPYIFTMFQKPLLLLCCERVFWQQRVLSPSKVPWTQHSQECLLYVLLLRVLFSVVINYFKHLLW